MSSVFLASDQFCDMGFNGPMRSGLVLDSRSLLVKGYTDYQVQLQKTLKGLFSGEWFMPHVPFRDNGMKIDIDTKRGNTIIPEYFIGRRLSGEALQDLLTEYGLRDHVWPTHDGISVMEDGCFYIDEIDIRMYDLGYGSVIFKGKIEAKRDLTLQEYRDLAERIGSELNEYKELFTGTFEKVAKVVAPEYVLFNFHDGLQKEEFWRHVSFGHAIGTMFWAHRLFDIPCDGENEFEARREACKALVYSEQADHLADSSVRDDMAFYPGNGNSAVIYDRRTAPKGEKEILTEMVCVQNVFYVTAEDIDRDLFYLSNELDRRKHSQDMKTLEKQSRIIVEYQSKIALFVAMYDDFDNHLDPQSVKIWHALESAWQTRDRFRNLDSKLDMIDKIYRRIMESLSHLYDKRLGTFVLAFTLISTLSVIVDTVDFTQGGDLGPPSTLRLIVLGAMGAMVLFLAMRLLRARD